MAKTTVYAVRESDTGIRVSYRYRSRADAQAELLWLKSRQASGRDPEKTLEVYRTTQDLPRAGAS